MGAKVIKGDCMQLIRTLPAESIDVVLTSPPYNMTNRKGGYADKTQRYDVYNDWIPEDEYIEWIVKLFNEVGEILNKRGVVLFNFSYSIENPSLPYKIVNRIEEKTNFSIIDTIMWKKRNAIPFPANKYRLGRIWEFVFVFVRKGYENDFNINRREAKTSKATGQKYYEIIQNYIEARNNDGENPLNKATFSKEFAKKLLNIYAPPESVVLDPFAGTGTTGEACVDLGLDFIGFEISEAQTDFANNRLKESEAQTRMVF